LPNIYALLMRLITVLLAVGIDLILKARNYITEILSVSLEHVTN